MIKHFLGLAALLILAIAMAVGHYLYVDRISQKDDLSNVVAVTGFVSPSLSTAFYEPKVLGEVSVQPISPSIQSLNRMDFVYAE